MPVEISSRSVGLENDAVSNDQNILDQNQNNETGSTDLNKGKISGNIANESKPEVFELKDKIESAITVDELIDIIKNEPTVYCDQIIHQGRELGKKISDAAEFLRKNFDQIILDTIIQKEGDVLAEFSKMFLLIPLENNLGIRKKAQELLRREINSYFEEKKADFALASVSAAGSLRQLCDILQNFKTIRQKEKVYDKEKVIQQIVDAEKFLLEAVEIGALAELSIEQIDAYINNLIVNLPFDCGIHDKAFGLLWQLVKEKRLSRTKNKEGK